jgi:hypothetical protein
LGVSSLSRTRGPISNSLFPKSRPKKFSPPRLRAELFHGPSLISILIEKASKVQKKRVGPGRNKQKNTKEIEEREREGIP